MTPDTRVSLLLRIRDPSDHDAWLEFVDIYSPVILRMATGKGLQLADAEDLVQQVLFSVSKAIEAREHDRSRAKFRTWLRRVAENAILNALTRAKPDRGTGGTDFVEILQQHSAPAEDSALLDRERKEEVFRHAAEQIRAEFTDVTWQAFWRSAVDGIGCQEVAIELGCNVGSVYAARSRVMKRLNEKVKRLQF
ncbi:MAG: RNA polymerase sigma factor [Rubripirellula sp.]